MHYAYLYLLCYVQEDLDTLAMGCLCANPKNPPLKLKQDLETVVKFCPAYCQIMEDKRLVVLVQCTLVLYYLVFIIQL